MNRNIEHHELIIYTLNCNSLNNKLGELKNLLDEREPDVFCLCETWLSERFVPKFKNYMAEWKHRGTAGGGLGILIQNGLQYRTLNVPEFAGGSLEAQIIKIFIDDSEPLHILNLYNPNKNVSIEELEYYVGKLGNKYLIIGDFNAHSPVLDSNVRSSNLTGRLLKALLPVSYTHLTLPTKRIV